MFAWSSIVLFLCTAYAVAESNDTSANAFSIPAGASSYTVTAGDTVDLSWSDKEGSTVTIKLQETSNITPSSGIVLADSISNTGSTTVKIPPGSELPDQTYAFEIINDENTDQYNFSPQFQIFSASGTGTLASSTYTASASASSSAASTTGSSASASTTVLSGTKSATSAAASSSGSASAAASSTTVSASASSTSAAAAATTSVPSSNSGFRAQAPFAGAVVLMGAAFML